MKIEQLLDSDLNVGVERRVQQLQQKARPRVALPEQIDLEHDAVYFGGDSSPRSFSGHLSESLEDEEVIEYIRRTNRALHDRLWGKLQNQPLESVTPAITEHPELSDGAGGDRPPNGPTDVLDSDMAGVSNASDESCTRRSISSALATSPNSVTSFGSYGGGVLLSPSNGNPAITPAVSAPRSKSELQQDLYLLQQRRYIQSLLLSE